MVKLCFTGDLVREHNSDLRCFLDLNMLYESICRFCRKYKQSTNLGGKDTAFTVKQDTYSPEIGLSTEL